MSLSSQGLSVQLLRTAHGAARLALGEGAELALEGAHVGVVDVAVHDIRHNVAAHSLAQGVRRLPYRLRTAHNLCIKPPEAPLTYACTAVIDEG